MEVGNIYKNNNKFFVVSAIEGLSKDMKYNIICENGLVSVVDDSFFDTSELVDEGNKNFILALMSLTGKMEDLTQKRIDFIKNLGGFGVVAEYLGTTSRSIYNWTRNGRVKLRTKLKLKEMAYKLKLADEGLFYEAKGLSGKNNRKDD